MHSKGKVSMYKPGDRPENLVNAMASVEGDTSSETTEDLVQTQTTTPPIAKVAQALAAKKWKWQ